MRVRARDGGNSCSREVEGKEEPARHGAVAMDATFEHFRDLAVKTHTKRSKLMEDAEEFVQR